MRENVQSRVNLYFDACNINKIALTKRGLAKELQTCPQTLRRVKKGLYNGKDPYTTKPHITRVFDNKDFEVLRVAFETIEKRSPP